jgi:hypothetical protein
VIIETRTNFIIRKVVCDVCKVNNARLKCHVCGRDMCPKCKAALTVTCCSSCHAIGTDYLAEMAVACQQYNREADAEMSRHEAAENALGKDYQNELDRITAAWRVRVAGTGRGNASNV